MAVRSLFRTLATPARRIWHWLGSIRLAVILLIALALAALVGTLFPQLPPEIAADPVARADWMTLARDRYGALTGLYRTLGLFDVFHSAWFLLLLVLLLLSTVVCTWNRLQTIWRILARPTIRMPNSFYRTGRQLTATGQPGQVAEAVEAGLRQRRYRVFREALEATTYIYADRHWIGRIGTAITHLAVVTLVVASAWGRSAGWREEQLVLPPGQPRPVGHGLPFGLRSEGFEILRYPSGMPRDYRADVTVLDDGGEVLHQTIRVNAPLTYRRVTFYLASFIPVPGRPEAAHVVLTAVHDPSYVPVIAAGVAMLIGLVLSFYFPHQRLWVIVAEDGGAWLVGRTEREKEAMAAWLDREVEALRMTLGEGGCTSGSLD